MQDVQQLCIGQLLFFYKSMSKSLRLFQNLDDANVSDFDGGFNILPNAHKRFIVMKVE